MPDTPDAVRLVLRDALAEVYAGANLVDVDALLDQMTDRGLRVADLAEQTHANCVSRAHYEAGEDRIDILREALDELLVLHDSPRARVLAALNRSRA